MGGGESTDYTGHVPINQRDMTEVISPRHSVGQDCLFHPIHSLRPPPKDVGVSSAATPAGICSE